MNTAITELDRKGYRKFGITTGVILVLLFGLAIPYLFNFNYPVWPWIIAAVLTAWGLVAPLTMKPLYIAWMRFGLVMNWINTRLILGILFYGIFLPFGLVFKITGKDPMRRKISENIVSYKESGELESKSNMENPY